MQFICFLLIILFVFNIVLVYSTNKHDVKGDFEVGESSQGGEHGPDNEGDFITGFRKAPFLVKELVLKTNLDDMERVGKEIVAQIEAVLLLNPPYKVPYQTDDGTIQYDSMEDEWEEIVDTLVNHDHMPVNPASEKDKLLLGTLMTKEPDEGKMADKINEILEKTNRFAIRLTRDIEKRNKVSNLFNDLVRQGMEKRNLKLSVYFGKAIPEMVLLLRTSFPKSSSWFNEGKIYLLNALFFNELRYIANANIMKLLEIVKELPESERQPEFVDWIINAKELKIMEQLAHFALIARNFYTPKSVDVFKESFRDWVYAGGNKWESAGWNECKRAVMAIFEDKDKLNEEIIRLKEEIEQWNEKEDKPSVSGQEQTQQNQKQTENTTEKGKESKH